MAKKTQKQRDNEEIQRLMATQNDEIPIGQEYIMKDYHHTEQDSEGEYSDYPAGSMSSGITEADLVGDIYADSASDAWSQQLEQERTEHREQVEILSGSVPEREDLSIGGGTSYDRQLSRFSNVESGIALRAAEFLEQPTAQDSIFSGVLSSQKKGNQSLIEARKAFGNVIGQNNINRFVKDLRKIASDGTTLPSVGSTQVKTAYSMIGKTASEFDTHGSNIYASDYTEEQQLRREQNVNDAHMKAYEFAEMYVDKGIPEGKIRNEAVNKNFNFILERAMEHRTSVRNVETDTYAGVVFEEVPVTDKKGNLVLDNNGQPSYHMQSRRMTASGAMPLPNEMPSEVGQLAQENTWSPRKALFSEDLYGYEGSQAMYQKSLREYKKMVDVIRGETVTLSDEFHGNRTRWSGQGKTQDTEWNQKQDLLNEAALLDLDRDTSDVTHSQEYLSWLDKGGAKGSSTGGLYGEKGLSETDEYINSRMDKDNPLSPDEALRELRGLKSPVIHTPLGYDDKIISAGDSELYGSVLVNAKELITLDEVVGGVSVDSLPKKPINSESSEEEKDAFIKDMVNSSASQREVYKKRIELYPSPEQGTQAWKDAAKGDITGSTLLLVDARDKTIENKAESLAAGIWDDFAGNTATREGTAKEPTIKKYLAEFLTGNLDSDLVRVNKNDSIGMSVDTKKKVVIEEAYREKIKELPGFSVSPDGFVFDEKGDSMGLAEFKYHSGENSEERLNKISKAHMNQMQMQMRVTKEKGVHFFRMNDKGQFSYDYVGESKELQDAIIKTNQKALDRAEEIKGGSMTVSHADTIEMGKGGATAYRPNKKVEEPAQPYRSNAEKSQEKVNNWVKGQQEGVNSNAGTMPDYEAMFDALEAEDLAAVNEEATKAAKEKAEADKEASRASKEFSKNLKDAGGAAVDLITKLAGLGTEGMESGINDVREAAKAGMKVDDYRNMKRNLMEDGNMTEAGATKAIKASADIAVQLNDKTRAAAFVKDKQASLRNMGLDTSIVSLDMIGNASTQKVMNRYLKSGKPMSEQDRVNYSITTGIDATEVHGGDMPEDIISGGKSLAAGEQGARKTDKDFKEVEYLKQTGKEKVADIAGGTALSVGNSVGFATAILGNTAALIANTTALLKSSAMGGLGGGNKILKAAKFLGPAAVAVGVSKALYDGVNETLDYGKQQQGMHKTTEEEREEISKKNDDFYNDMSEEDKLLLESGKAGPEFYARIAKSETSNFSKDVIPSANIGEIKSGLPEGVDKKPINKIEVVNEINIDKDGDVECNTDVNGERQNSLNAGGHNGNNSGW